MSDGTEEPTKTSPLKNGNPKHELTREDVIKGGRSRSLKKLINNQLLLRKYCNETCPIFKNCWARDLVIHDPKYTDPINKKYLCALKSFNERLQTSTIDLLAREETGLMEVMRSLMARLIVHIDVTDKKDIGYAIDKLGFVMDKLYGQKHKTELSGHLSLNEEFTKIVEESMKDELEGNNEGATASVPEGPGTVQSGDTEEGAGRDSSADNARDS